MKCKFLTNETLKKKCKIVNDHMITDPIGPFQLFVIETIDIGGKGCNAIYKTFQSCSSDVIEEVRSKMGKKSNDGIEFSSAKHSFRFTQKCPNVCVYIYIYIYIYI